VLSKIKSGSFYKTSAYVLKLDITSGASFPLDPEAVIPELAALFGATYVEVSVIPMIIIRLSGLFHK
jgi:hypothetical protein